MLYPGTHTFVTFLTILKHMASILWTKICALVLTIPSTFQLTEREK